MEANVQRSQSASGESSSLVHLETNDHAAPVERPDAEPPGQWAQTPAQKRLHARWWNERGRIIDALLNGDGPLSRRALRIENCCSHPALTKRANGTVGMVLYCCKDRLCPRCQTHRGQRAARKISGIVGSMNSPRTIELTKRHLQAPLAFCIDDLWRCFKALRKTAVWKRHVKGGVGVLEITINEQDRTWHPHLHLVFDGQYFPYKLLSDAWEEVTGDSKIVYIQAVHDREKTANYVGRYLAKSISMETLDAIEIREYAAALSGRRLVFTFGSVHNSNPDPRKDAKPHGEDTPLLSVHRLTASANEGNVRAQRVVDLLRGVSPVWCSALGYLPFSTGAKPAPLSLADDRFVIEVCEEILNEPAEREAAAEADAEARQAQAAELHQLSLSDFAAAPPTKSYR